MNPRENQLVESLRDLNELSPNGAPPALGEMLKGEFRRHHAQRRKKRAAQISLLAACLIAIVTLSILLRQHGSNSIARYEQKIQPPQAQPVMAGFPEQTYSQPEVKNNHLPVRAKKTPATVADRFVALPTFNPAIPIDHLEMVRMDVLGRDLRLVGFPVNEEIADRRVVADFLLAQDGTPYAMRFVQSSQTKEH